MADPRLLTISDSAVKHISAIKDSKNDPNLFFRLTVSGGGCSGFKYIYEFDTEKRDDDIVFINNGVAVATDDMSLNFLNGAELDFQQDLMGSRFFVNNPNANSACGCGTSFSMSFDKVPVTLSADK